MASATSSLLGLGPGTPPDDACVLLLEKPAPPLPCIVCTMKNTLLFPGQAARRCVPSTVRCRDHQLECAICFARVRSDTHLCCSSCWGFSKFVGVQKSLLASLEKPTLCSYTYLTTDLTATWACGCHSCIQMTILNMKCKAMEEGVDLLPPIHPPEPEHISVEIGFQVVVE